MCHVTIKMQCLAEDELNGSLLDAPFVVKNNTFQTNSTESVP